MLFGARRLWKMVVLPYLLTIAVGAGLLALWR